MPLMTQFPHNSADIADARFFHENPTGIRRNQIVQGHTSPRLYKRRHGVQTRHCRWNRPPGPSWLIIAFDILLDYVLADQDGWHSSAFAERFHSRPSPEAWQS